MLKIEHVETRVARAVCELQNALVGLQDLSEIVTKSPYPKEPSKPNTVGAMIEALSEFPKDAPLNVSGFYVGHASVVPGYGDEVLIIED